MLPGSFCFCYSHAMTTASRTACLFCFQVLASVLSIVSEGCSPSKGQETGSQQNSVPRAEKISLKKSSSHQISKAEFNRWLNDPNIDRVERAARITLGWQIQGAVHCGKIDIGWMGGPTQPYDKQKMTASALRYYKKHAPFLYTIENTEYAEGMVENPVYTESYRAIVGTQNGEIHEFVWNCYEYKKISHRKWQKPTVRQIGNDILFFDAGQTMKK
jgi:hypothetical protein